MTVSIPWKTIDNATNDLVRARDMADVLATAFRSADFNADDCLEGLHAIALEVSNGITKAIGALEQTEVANDGR